MFETVALTAKSHPPSDVFGGYLRVSVQLHILCIFYSWLRFQSFSLSSHQKQVEVGLAHLKVHGGQDEMMQKNHWNLQYVPEGTLKVVFCITLRTTCLFSFLAAALLFSFCLQQPYHPCQSPPHFSPPCWLLLTPEHTPLKPTVV